MGGDSRRRRRTLGFDDETVDLAYKDYRYGDRRNAMTISAGELIRPFLLHGLTKSFVRVRGYSFLANPSRGTRLGEIRSALAAPPVPQNTAHATAPERERPRPGGYYFHVTGDPTAGGIKKVRGYPMYI